MENLKIELRIEINENGDKVVQHTYKNEDLTDNIEVEATILVADSNLLTVAEEAPTLVIFKELHSILNTDQYLTWTCQSNSNCVAFNNFLMQVKAQIKLLYWE